MAFNTSTAITMGLMAASIATTAASSGLSYYAQQEQAANAQRMADYNYAIQRQNAEIQAKMAQYQADVNARTAQAQYQAGMNNATTLEGQASAVEAQGRERVRRMREENLRMLAVQRAKYAKSGVVSSEGTPIAVMTDTAGTLELGVQDAAYETELDSRSLRRQAEVERYRAGFSLLDAGVANYEAEAAKIGRKINLRQAEINKIAGYSQAQGLRTSSYGTLIAGASDATNTIFRAL